MSLKKVFLAVSAVIILVGCQTDNDFNFNHQGKYNEEKPIIDEFLATYMYSVDTDELVPLEEGGVALIKDDNLEIIETTHHDVDYQMFVYKTKEGVRQDGSKFSPDDNDIVDIAFELDQLTQLDGGLLSLVDVVDVNLKDNFVDLNTGERLNFNSNGRIFFEGEILGLTKLTAGEAVEVSDDLPREYTNPGQGFFIIPSGLSIIEGNPVIERGANVYKMTLRALTQVENP